MGSKNYITFLRVKKIMASNCHFCSQDAEFPLSEPTKCQSCWTAATCVLCGPMRAAWSGAPLKDGVCAMCKPRVKVMPKVCIQCNKADTLYPKLFPLKCYTCFVGEESVVTSMLNIRCGRCACFVKKVLPTDSIVVSYCSRCEIKS